MTRPKAALRSAYVPPLVEVEAMVVEEGFADSVTEEWRNSFSVEPSSEAGKVDLVDSTAKCNTIMQR